MYMKYSAVRNCKWANAEHTVIECEVNFNDITDEEWSPFGATATDHYEHTKEIFAKSIAGEFGEIAEYVEPQLHIIEPKNIELPTDPSI
jgi:hypothetical protein